MLLKKENCQGEKTKQKNLSSHTCTWVKFNKTFQGKLAEQTCSLHTQASKATVRRNYQYIIVKKNVCGPGFGILVCISKIIFMASHYSKYSIIIQNEINQKSNHCSVCHNPISAVEWFPTNSTKFQYQPVKFFYKGFWDTGIGCWEGIKGKLSWAV